MFYYRPQSWNTRRSTEDFANINGFSMMVFIILMALLTHGHGMSFQDRCLGFPKRPCFPKFMKMVAHGAPVTDGLDEFRSLRSEDTKRYKNLEWTLNRYEKANHRVQVDTPKMRQHPKWDTNKSLLISIFWRREGLLQRYATPRHLHEFQKIRMIWKAKETTFRSH